MKMKKSFLMIFTLICCISAIHSQDMGYKTAIGLRLGYPLSASFKTFISDKNAIEAYAGFRSYSLYKWVNIGALYQVHNSIGSVDGLSWYYGGGANVFFWSYDSSITGASSTTFGIAGNLGLDYKFANSPFNLSADWVPIFFIGGDYLTGFGGAYGGLAVRYVLK